MRSTRSEIRDFITIVGVLLVFVLFTFALTAATLRQAADYNYEHEGEGRR